MRKIVISLAAAASALAVASPAAAQWAPQHHAPQGYGYGYGYGQNNWGQVRELQSRVAQLRERIHRLDRSNRLGNREARRLDYHAMELHRRIHHSASRGLRYHEMRDLQYRIDALRQAVRYAAREDNRWGWNGRHYDNGFGYFGARVRDNDRRFDDDDRFDGDDDRRRDRRNDGDDD